MRLPRTLRAPRSLAVALIAGTVVLAPAGAAFADSPVTPAKAETTSDAQAKADGKHYIHLSGGDTVALDIKGLTAEIGANAPVGRLSVTRPGPVKSGYSGWTYRLFVPASKPDLNPPHVVATYRGKLMQKIYFTPTGKKPAPATPRTAMTPTGAVKAGAEPVAGQSEAGARNSNAILLASGGGAAVAAGLGFGAMRRRHESSENATA
ncbi:hypothetical protein P8605_30375 [Streptomyces sp. T-3]|nr:hypothetical protein [Streptomyces sp. T-3]